MKKKISKTKTYDNGLMNADDEKDKGKRKYNNVRKFHDLEEDFISKEIMWCRTVHIVDYKSLFSLRINSPCGLVIE